MRMKPGTVVTVDFHGVQGFKRRPAIVVSSETYNEAMPDVILAVVTSRVEKATANSDYILEDWQAANLTKPSAVRMFLWTSPQAGVTRIGNLSDNDWELVKLRLRSAVAT